MWSLYKKKKSEDIKEDSECFEHDGDKLDPLIFSNGKSQVDVVKEILDEIKNGTKVIFIKGVCGTGKSVIALNLARHFKKTSIVVPIKSLQEQYEYDYTKEKFILKEDKSKLKIAVIKGRNNFECPFMGGNADADDLPCKIEIREKNKDKIIKYIEQNEDVDKLDFSSMSDVKRFAIAPACPYWSPLLPAEINNKILNKASSKIKYKSISDKEYCLYKRQKGCKYYEQYESYSSADVLIFNSLKYILEIVLGRKPKTELDIIDECDEFLDSFANEKTINLNRLSSALSNIFPDNIEKKQVQKEMIHMINSFLYDSKEIEIDKLYNTDFVKFIELILSNPYLAEDEEDSYYNRVFEIAKEFEPFLDETYASFSRKASFKTGEANLNQKQSSLFGDSDSFSLFGRKEKEQGNLTLLTINLAKRFEDLLNKTQTLVLMSGTLHSEQVLKDIFGLKSFKVIEAEIKNPGTIVKYRTGREKNCKYENFRSGLISRRDYLTALSTCVANAEKPVLIHVNSFDDLPSDVEREEFGLHNLITKEKLKELQEKGNEQVDNFKKGKSDILFTTKCSRGIDFPGKMCNSIIITKYPYPNIQELFWKILRREKPNEYTAFYWDKARRDLVQKIARGVRFKGDHVILLSPDSRVLDADLR
jgi:Rad3-related DNA helicase